MKQTLKLSLKLLFVMTVILGIAYPLTMTGIGQLFFHDKVNGQLIVQDQQVVGSEIIGQSFTQEKYLHGRPQTVSQLSPVSDEQKEIVEERIIARQQLEGRTDKVPSDLVLASASGVDPEITLEAAQYQVPRIAKNRQVTEKIVDDIINQYISGTNNFMISNERVNVLAVNLALDAL